MFTNDTTVCWTTSRRGLQRSSHGHWCDEKVRWVKLATTAAARLNAREDRVDGRRDER